MRINKYLPFAAIYFFFNSWALPFGLTWTAVLAPFFYAWVLWKRKRELLLPFIAILLPFVLITYLTGHPDEKSLFISLANFLLVYIFCQAAYTFFIICRDVEKIFRWILVVNFAVCLVAVPLYFTPYDRWLWLEQGLSAGLGHFRRLRLLTYEPSYYALLFTPVFFFYLLQYFLKQNKIPAVWLLPMLFLPHVLSFSIGVIVASLAAGLLTWIIWLERLSSRRRILNAMITAGGGLSAGLFVLLLFFRQNALFTRIGNIFLGNDSSGKGRTFDAFVLAERILHTGNEYWGIGAGQIKIAGENIIRNYYMYYMDFTVAIPNATAETLALFGWVGLGLRFFLEIFFFFLTRVWTNYYRLLLFLFIFIYQFTGSFVTNVAEYVIWILAFTNIFRQFDVTAATGRPAKPVPQPVKA